MKNLVFQYYIPYEMGDRDLGGIELPDWAQAGSRSAQAYAEYCGAEYVLDHNLFDSTILKTKLTDQRLFSKIILILFQLNESRSVYSLSNFHSWIILHFILV